MTEERINLLRELDEIETMCVLKFVKDHPYSTFQEIQNATTLSTSKLASVLHLGQINNVFYWEEERGWFMKDNSPKENA